jgi:hypothetical protein
MIDDLIDYCTWLRSERPSRAWQRAAFAAHGNPGDRRPLRWMAKHLQIDHADPRTWFALAGFAPMRINDAWHIAAVTPAPDPFDEDSFSDGEVVLVDPETRRTSLLGDPSPSIIAPHPQPDAITVYTDGLKWLRAWADERVIFFEHRRSAIERSRIIPTFMGEPPAALAIGDINRVPWSRLYAKTIRADFEHAKAIKRAIFRAADLPTVEAA